MAGSQGAQAHGTPRESRVGRHASRQVPAQGYSGLKGVSTRANVLRRFIANAALARWQ